MPGDSLERVEAAKEIIEQRAIDCGRAYFVFQHDQGAADQHQVFVTLGVIIVEELIEKLTTVVGTWFIH